MFKSTKKEAEAAQAAIEADAHQLHNAYRPESLKRYIGQDAVKTRVQGMINTGKIPSAMIFFGPPSAGKTTLARIIAAEVNGKPAKKQQDYKEINAATQKGIDNVRELEKLSKFRAMGNRRFIVIDEVQQILTNEQAAQALLKPLEEPSADTTWILCSMEPSKFTSTVGKAILKRCTQFVLQEPSQDDLLKQALRIAKGEGMDYVLDEERSLLRDVVNRSNADFRELANLMQTLQQYHDGLTKKPKMLTTEALGEALSSISTEDSKLALEFMTATYELSFRKLQRVLMDVQNPVEFMRHVMWLAEFVLNADVLGNGKHRKVWWNEPNKAISAVAKKNERNLGFKAEVYSKIVEIAGKAITAGVPATSIISAEMYYLFKSLASKLD